MRVSRKKPKVEPYYSTEILPSSPFINKISFIKYFHWIDGNVIVRQSSSIFANHHRSPTQIPYQEMFSLPQCHMMCCFRWSLVTTPSPQVVWVINCLRWSMFHLLFHLNLWVWLLYITKRWHCLVICVAKWENISRCGILSLSLFSFGYPVGTTKD